VESVKGLCLHELLHPNCAETDCALETALASSWETFREAHAAETSLTDRLLNRSILVSLYSPAGGVSEPDEPVLPYAVVTINDVTEIETAHERLRTLNSELERRVVERTAKLREKHNQLVDEVARRMAVEIELSKRNEAMTRLSEQLIEAQEGERRRISMELHDAIGQKLSALKYTVERSLELLDRKRLKEAREILNRSIPAIRQAQHDARAISMNLRPSLLDDMGAIAAIKWLCREFETTYPQTRTIVNCAIEDGDVPEKLVAHMFRTVQESLNNVAKHARASNVVVNLAMHSDRIVLEVLDDGEGMDLGNVTTDAGLGIMGMRERAKISGGRFQISSAPGANTTVRVEWDLSETRSERGGH
jgi:signal transduction histidine kinase